MRGLRVGDRRNRPQVAALRSRLCLLRLLELLDQLHRPHVLAIAVVAGLADAAAAEPVAFEVFAVALGRADQVVATVFLRALAGDGEAELTIVRADLEPARGAGSDLDGLDAARIVGADGDRHDSVHWEHW